MLFRSVGVSWGWGCGCLRLRNMSRLVCLSADGGVCAVWRGFFDDRIDGVVGVDGRAVDDDDVWAGKRRRDVADMIGVDVD